MTDPDAHSAMEAGRALSRGWRFWVPWYVLALALLALIPSAKWALAPWALPAAESSPVLLLAAAFMASTIAPVFRLLRGQPMRAGQVLLWTLAIFGVAALYLALTGTHASRRVLATIPLVCAVLLPVSFAARRGRGLILLILAVADLLLLASVLYAMFGPLPKISPHVQRTYVKTAFYNLEMNSYEGYIPRPAARGGGIDRIGDRYLLATGDGHMYLFGWSGSGDLSVEPLTYRVPINGEEFATAVGGHYEQPRQVIPSGDTGGSQIDTWRFHVSDILVQELGDRVRVFAGYHHWDAVQRCFTTRVSMTESDRAAFLAGSARLEWKTLFEATPCLPIDGPLRERTEPFEGNTSGGRLALRDPDTILFTVGYHGFDGVNSLQAFGQDPQISWGTVVEIHVSAAKSETFSIGHRNEQGLYIDPQGGIWETEHGPQGGDELNYLEQGANYGWPLVTYGTDYNSLVWPPSKTQGRHTGFREPIYSWVPSIGVSNLIGIERDLFPVWKGDLLVASLKAGTLFRIGLVDRRAVFAEPIEVGKRIRALRESREGAIVLYTDDDAIISIKPATGMSRELLFSNMCGGCHKVVDGTQHMIGPDLAHVYGRRIASADGFGDYSGALKAAGGKWDGDKLDRFLTSPQAFAPGTIMPFAGIKDPAQRAEIIGYLKSAE